LDEAVALLTEFSRRSTLRAEASRIGFGLDFP